MKIVKNIFYLSVILMLVPFFASCGEKSSEKIAVEKSEESAVEASQMTGEEPEVLYWTCGMHPSVASEEPGNCPICNMKLTPVYKEDKKEAMAEQEVYYGCGCSEEAMCPCHGTGDPDAICTCKDHAFMMKGSEAKMHDMKCPVCGAPLQRLSEETVQKFKQTAGRVRLSTEQVRRTGIETYVVERMPLFKEIRTVGKIAYDPELSVAQEEYLSALESYEMAMESDVREIKENAKSLLRTSKRRLKILGMSDKEIEKLEAEGTVDESLLLPAETMWVYADVYEMDLPLVDVGDELTVVARAIPGKEFKGEVVSIDPIIDPNTRSVRIRAVIENRDLLLKPEMYVDVVISSSVKGHGGAEDVLAVPVSAVLDTGERKVIWVEVGEGLYEGREVKTGSRVTAVIGDAEVDVYPVFSGILEGEEVVTKANFLIDSQSQLTGMAAAAYGGALGEEGETEMAQQPPNHQH